MTDPELSDGARNLFTLLLDYSLNPGRWFKRKGQVAISNTQLRERLSRSARAIYGWTRELIQQRHIWVTKWGRPNMQPMNVFHIAALQPDRQVGPEIQNEGMWGDGYRRPEMVMPLGARGGTCKKRHYLFDQYGKPVIAQVPVLPRLEHQDGGEHPQRMPSFQAHAGHRAVPRERRGQLHRGKAGRPAGCKGGRQAGQGYPDKTSGVRLKMSLEGGVSAYRVHRSASRLDTIWTEFRGRRVRSMEAAKACV